MAAPVLVTRDPYLPGRPGHPQHPWPHKRRVGRFLRKATRNNGIRNAYYCIPSLAPTAHCTLSLSFHALLYPGAVLPVTLFQRPPVPPTRTSHVPEHPGRPRTTKHGCQGTCTLNAQPVPLAFLHPQPVTHAPSAPLPVSSRSVVAGAVPPSAGIYRPSERKQQAQYRRCCLLPQPVTHAPSAFLPVSSRSLVSRGRPPLCVHPYPHLTERPACPCHLPASPAWPPRLSA